MTSISIRRRLEQDGVLNPSDDGDIFCLHLCVGHFLARAVDNFIDGWNLHPISTEGNATPLQLFYTGILKLAGDGLYHPELHQSPDAILFGEQEAAVISEFYTASRRPPVIEVPSFAFPLTGEQLNRVESLVVPQQVSFENLRSKYLLTKRLVFPDSQCSWICLLLWNGSSFTLSFNLPCGPVDEPLFDYGYHEIHVGIPDIPLVTFLIVSMYMYTFDLGCIE